MRSIIRLLLVCSLAFTGCRKVEDDAIIINKEHIAAAPEPATPTPGASPAEDPELNVTREMAPDEIAVDGLVMKARDRGTSRDPRAMKDEQWLATVRLVGNGRIFNVLLGKAQFEQLKEGDQVHVRYQVGKYTGTVWGAEIVKQ